MAEEAASSAITLMLIACGLSMAALAFLFQKHVSGRSLLAYEPRRRVPWGPLVALLAMSMPILIVVSFFVGGKQSEAKEASTETLLTFGWANFALMILFVLGGIAWLRTFFQADAHDLGLPTSWRQLADDIGLGIFATVAALLPIYAVQLFLIFALQSETQHPLVEQLQEHQSSAMLLLSFAMAVIAAPLFEEFTFRGLLQGWLERHEDEILGFTATERPTPIVSKETDANKIIHEASSLRLASDSSLRLANETSPSLATETTNFARPAQGWIPDLPHGWTPILVSGVAFGLAHVGHGVAPISLVLFGIVLGYLYQRTHRLVPSITAHMLFNSYSMVLLWLQLETPPVS